MNREVKPTQPGPTAIIAMYSGACANCRGPFRVGDTVVMVGLVNICMRCVRHGGLRALPGGKA